MTLKRLVSTLAAGLMVGGTALTGLAGTAHHVVASSARADFSGPQVTISDFEFPDGFGPGNGLLSDTEVATFGSYGLDILDNNLNPVPVLAAMLPTTKNGGVKTVNGNLQVTWTLKPNLKWADGTPLTAKQFVFGEELAETPEAGGGTGADLIKTMSATNDTTLVVTYSGVYADYLILPPGLLNYADLAAKYKTGDISQFTTGSYDATKWAQYVGGPSATAPASGVANESNTYKGSSLFKLITGYEADAFTSPDDGFWNGPYKLSEYIQAQRITMVPNPYWNALPSSKPLPSKVVFANISSNEAAYVTALQSPSTLVNQAEDFQVSDLPILNTISRFRVTTQPDLEIEHLELNTANPYLKDVRVRQALAMSIDKVALVHQLFPQIASPASFVLNSTLPPLFPWTDKSLGNSYNLAAAKLLLQQAGYSSTPYGPGKHVFISLDSTARQPRVKALEIIQRDWLKIGVVAKINYPKPASGIGGLFASYDKSGLLARRNFNVALFAWAFTGGSPDEATFFDPKFIPTTGNHSAGQQNYTGANDPVVTNAAHAANQAADAATRAKDLNIVQREVVKQAYWIPLFVRSNISIDDRSIANYAPNPDLLNHWNAFAWSKAAQ